MLLSPGKNLSVNVKKFAQQANLPPPPHESKSKIQDPVLNPFVLKPSILKSNENKSNERISTVTFRVNGRTKNGFRNPRYPPLLKDYRQSGT